MALRRLLPSCLLAILALNFFNIPESISAMAWSFTVPTPLAPEAAAGAFVLALTDIEQKEQELQEINELIAKYERLYQEKGKEEKQVLGEINKLEVNIDALEKDIDTLKEQIALTETQVRTTQQEIDQATVLVNERTDYFNARLRSIYREGNMEILDVLLGSASLTDFLTSFDFMAKITDNDIKLMRELQTGRTALMLKKNQLEEEVEHFNNLKGQKENKQEQLEIQSRQKNTLLKSIQEQKEAYTRSLDELEKIRQGIDDFIREWQAKHQKAYMGTGRMAWPVPGHTSVSSNFGYRIHPIFKVRRFHYGIDIPAPKGTKVVAVERGTVLFMGNKGGYGNAVIIDHGGGVSTQYSHLWSYAPGLAVGDTVEKEELVGLVDSTGWSTGNHLDFIVRLNGKPQNPLLPSYLGG